ncbi:dephospho-CoA kinase [Halomonas caseinilytica]|uniref:dephospho-CoA kinase n=1 Tax=Halomonas caseinilytica TaxID=438744 RepID=UPI0007E5A5CF|nr:dephospho-CoA kinase [Halomonas caseinilytica]SEM19402.1 dephospho-CoA kinase [Halomonas caseinilytica]
MTSRLPIIGITGGIASGKSTVARAFARLGIPWVDADDIAREIVAPGEPALDEIHRRHGSRILLEDGQLDRRALRDIVFADEAERHWLESVTHPRIRARLNERLDDFRQREVPYALLVSPLLFESGQSELVDRCLVIDVPESLQIARTARRDGVDESQARAIVAAQMSREERLSRADDILLNEGDEQDLADRVAELDRKYRALAGLPPAR